MESAGKRNACRQFELLLDGSDVSVVSHKRAQHPSCSQDKAAPLPTRASYENACSISVRIYNGFERSECALAEENILEIYFVKELSARDRCWRTFRNLASRVAALPMMLSTYAHKLRSPSGRNVAISQVFSRNPLHAPPQQSTIRRFL